jgi:TPR repeat protein
VTAAGRCCALLTAVWLASLLLAGLNGTVVAAEQQPAERRAQLLKNEAKRLYWGVGGRQDYRRALELYEQAAALGDAEASYIAGGMYYTAKGTTMNLAKAFTYLDFAARQGESSPASQRALAEFYLLGSVVPQNFGKAADWYEQAAANGDTAAQIELGFLHFVGRGVEQDFAKAYELFRQAAFRNSGVAQYNLGIIWYTGNGVEQSDLTKAYAWFSIAAGNGFRDGVQARDYLATVLSEAEIARGQDEASRLFREIRSGQTATGRTP